MRGQALVWSGRIKQEEFFKKKKRTKRHSVTVWGIFLQMPLLHPYPCPATRRSCGVEEGPMVTPESLGRMGTQTCGTSGYLPCPSSRGQTLKPTAPGGRVPDAATQRHLAPNPCDPGEAAEELCTCIFSSSNCDWLSKRKVETPLQRRTAGLRESAIPRKT